MEAKYVYRVAFGKTRARILALFFSFIEREVLQTTVSLFIRAGDASVSPGEKERRRPAGDPRTVRGIPRFGTRGGSRCAPALSQIQGFWSRYPAADTHTRRVAVVWKI